MTCHFDPDGRYELTRRSFLAGTACGSLGLAMGLGSRASAEAPLFAAEEPASRLVLVRDEAAVDAKGRTPDPAVVSSMLDRAMSALTGKEDAVEAWASLFSAEDTVGVKTTHCTWMRVHTEDAVADAIVARLRGIGLAEDRIRVGDYGLDPTGLTALIDAPSVKVHTQTGIAAALKNYINFAEEPKHFHKRNSEKLGQIWQRPELAGKTRLVVTDLLRPYFGPGPQLNPAHRWAYRGLMVGTDPVAADTVCLALCQRKRDLYKGEPWPITPPALSIPAADERYGLGVSDPAKIRLDRLGWQGDALL
jgi:hypothetical protein